MTYSWTEVFLGSAIVAIVAAVTAAEVEVAVIKVLELEPKLLLLCLTLLLELLAPLASHGGEATTGATAVRMGGGCAVPNKEAETIIFIPSRIPHFWLPAWSILMDFCKAKNYK